MAAGKRLFEKEISQIRSGIGLGSLRNSSFNSEYASGSVSILYARSDYDIMFNLEADIRDYLEMGFYEVSMFISSPIGTSDIYDTLSRNFASIASISKDYQNGTDGVLVKFNDTKLAVDDVVSNFKEVEYCLRRSLF